MMADLEVENKGGREEMEYWSGGVMVRHGGEEFGTRGSDVPTGQIG